MDRWPLVGRGAEVAALSAAVVAGRGAVISGASGVGKTSLARRAVAVGHGRGMSVLRATATRASRGLPFGVFASVLPPDPGGNSLVREERGNLLRRYLRAVVEGAEGRGLLLSVDDAQLLDDGSATLVHQLASTGAATVLATVRSGEPVPDPVLALWKEGLCERIDIDVLPGAAVEELLVAVLGGPVDAATVRRLLDRCRGNPLFLRELVTAALETGTLVEQGGVWRLTKDLPPSSRLVELVGWRLGDLPGPQRLVLELLALGEPLGQARLSELTDPEAVDALERQGLISSRIEGRRLHVWLAHPIYGEVVRAGISVRQERALARSQAEVLEATGVRRREDTLLLASLRLTGGGGSAQLLRAGANAAMARHDYALTERLARAANPEGAGFEASLLAAEAAGLLGRPDQAEAELAALAADASSDAEKARVALLRFDNSFHLHGQDDFGVIEQAAEVVTDPLWREELLSRRLFVLGMNAGPAAVVDAASAPFQIPVSGPFTASELVVLFCLARVGRLKEALRLLALPEPGEAVLAADQMVEHWPLFGYRALTLAYAGRLAEAEEILTRTHARLLELPPAEAVASLTLWMAHLHLEQGRVRSAWHRAMESAALCQQIGHPLLARVGYTFATQAQAMAGRADQAAETLGALDALNLPPMRVSEIDLLQARAWTAAAGGDLPAARRHLNQAADVGAEIGDLIGAASALHDLARLGQASQIADRLADLATGVDGALVAARADYATAVAAQDSAALAAVCNQFEAMGANLYAAEASAEAALLLHRAGQTRQAGAAEQQAARLLARCEGASTPAVRAITARVHLTAAEHDVAVLAAAGRSNKQIATDLHLSVRTVESHLQRAYEKLGINGRHELAANVGHAAGTPETSGA